MGIIFFVKNIFKKKKKMASSSKDEWCAVEKLKGNENYHTWSFAIKTLLELNNLENCILKPESTNYETDLNKLKQAKARIILSVYPSIFPHIQNLESASKIWEKLSTMFEDSGLLRRIGLLRRLITTNLETCESMYEYVIQITDTSNKLNGIGFVVNDEWLGSILLAGLTENFKPMIMNIESSGVTLSADTIKTKLLDTAYENNQQNESAFMSKNKNEHKFEKFKRNFKCFKCGRKGHTAKYCKFKNNEVKSEGSNKEIKSALCTYVLNASSFNKNINENEWYIDSGASKHMTPFKHLLLNFQETNVTNIVTANSEKVPVLGMGKMEVRIADRIFEIKNVLFVPGLSANLLSVTEMVKNGNKVLFNEDKCNIFDSRRKIIFSTTSVEGIYKINVDETKCFTSKIETNGLEWHRRLGHVNFSDMMKMNEGIVNGIDFKNCNETDIKNCITCKEGKQTRKSFSRSVNRCENILDLIHSDLCGPMENISIGGARYMLTFIDDHSRKIFVYFLKEKSETVKKFIEFKSMVERSTNRKIKMIRTDNGTEYLNEVFQNELKKCGIKHQKSNVYTPEQNGVAERTNRKLIEKAKCMIFDANLEKPYWAEAMNFAAYILNHSVNSVLVTKTPEEIWSGNKVDVSHLRIFGCPVMVHVPKQKRYKLDKVSSKILFMGFTDDTKGFRCIDPITKKVCNSRDVVFIEDSRAISTTSCESTEENTKIKEIIPNLNFEEDVDLESVHSETINESDESFESSNDIFSDYEDTTVQETTDNPVQRSERIPKPKTFEDFHLFFANLPDDEDEPITLTEALCGPNSIHWKNAMKEELQALKESNTWVYTSLPDNRKTIKTKWVYKIK